MARGLNIATNYYNRIEALKDFNSLAKIVIDAGQAQLAIKHQPDMSFGWRKIDKCTAALRKEWEELLQSHPLDVEEILEEQTLCFLDSKHNFNSGNGL